MTDRQLAFTLGVMAGGIVRDLFAKSGTAPRITCYAAEIPVPGTGEVAKHVADYLKYQYAGPNSISTHPEWITKFYEAKKLMETEGSLQ